MAKQAMAWPELVRHPETHGHVVRVPGPNDGRAKLVLPTDRGRDVITAARNITPQTEDRSTALLGRTASAHSARTRRPSAAA